MDKALNHILDESCNRLAAAANAHGHALRTLTIGHHTGGYVNAYTVVLRDFLADEKKLLFYTDIRSAKVQDIKQDNRLTALGYDDEEKLQLILKGEAVIHYQNKTAMQYWKKSGYKGRKAYLAQPAPSTPVTQQDSGIRYLQRKDFADEDNTGYENFAVIEIPVVFLEYVKLESAGNSRARFNKTENHWQGQWLIP